MVGWATMVFRSLCVAIPLALGGVVISMSKVVKSEPQVKDAVVQPRPVRVLTLAPIDLVPRVRGYGAVEPDLRWRAVTRIDGEILWTSDSLANGLVVEKGEELLRIDDSAILLSLAQIDAQIAALTVKEETLHASLVIGNDDLGLSRKQLERQKSLQSNNFTSAAETEQAQRQELSARSNVKNIENQLTLNDAENAVLSAQRAIAARDLDYAVITAPYAIRIGEVQADLGQYVTRGQTLFSTEGIEQMEVSALIPIGRMAPLVRTTDAQGQELGVLGLDAVVRLRSPSHVIEWPARVDRVGEGIDSRTQSTHVIVSVDQPISQARPGVRPPLRQGMFVEVELSAPSRQVLAVPVAAVHNGAVLVAGKDGKLESRPIEIAFTIGTLAIIESGLEEGTRVVVTDMSIAVPGMKIKPIEDKALKKRIVEEAALAGAGR